MDDKPEILTFPASDTRIQLLKERLDNLNIEYSLRETTAYMEAAYEMKIGRSNIATVDLILNELTSWDSSDDNETNTVLGRIRSLGSLLTWVAILLTFGLLIYMSRLILNGDLPGIAWTAVGFMILLLGFIAYLEMKKK